MQTLPTGQRIIIAPLDWGLGHATRCVPLIRKLRENNEVIIGTTPTIHHLLEEEFPDLQKIEIPSYNIQYSKHLPAWLHLMLRAPRFFRAIRNEHNALSKIIAELKPSLIISDSRLGFHSKETRSILITHQLFLKSPLFNAVAQRVNKNKIMKFGEVWVPDMEEGGGLSGALSHGKQYHPHVSFTGPASRLVPMKQEAVYDHLIFMSGPQPQLRIVERALYEAAIRSRKKIAMITRDQAFKSAQNVDVIQCPDGSRISSVIAASRNIICRSGYSTLMDMYILGKKDLTLIPTPGQPEQVYLAGYWKEKFNARLLTQGKSSQAFG